MSNLIAGILNINPALAGTLVGLLVFAEDALFVGFVIPGETAAVLGGVLASLGHVPLWLILPIVVLAAIVGDTVGYEVGKHFGPALLNLRVLAKRRGRLDRAQDFLRRRGGLAVFLGRFVAFFRAVMPALAGTSRMPYPRFVVFNAAGGIVWGTIYVLLGFFAGKSYEVVARTVGQDTAIVVGAVVVIGIISWQVVSRLRRRHPGVDPDGARENHQ
ncbi:MAG: DedA family protein [Acidobacteria bacterium]|nr:DedA family protein [Acidobacteriota bacterium]